MDDIEAAVDEDEEDKEEESGEQDQDQVIEEGSSDEKDSLEETDKKTVGRVTMYDEWLAMKSQKDDPTSEYMPNGIPKLNIDQTTTLEEERRTKNQTHCQFGTEHKSDLLTNIRASKDDYHSIVSSTDNLQRAPLPNRPKTREIPVSLQ